MSSNRTMHILLHLAVFAGVCGSVHVALDPVADAALIPADPCVQ